jgi:hypothetical protein
LEKLKVRYGLEEIGIGARIRLKWILKKGGRMWTGVI